jgi:hypothetical protein
VWKCISGSGGCAEEGDDDDALEDWKIDFILIGTRLHRTMI